MVSVGGIARGEEMNELKELILFKLTTEIGYWDVVNERENSVDMMKILDVVCNAIADYLKGGKE